MVIESIRQYFSGLPDPRRRRGRRHQLDELVIIAILAVLCCTDNWQEVAQFAWAKRKWLKTFLELPHGIPSHDTFGRLIRSHWQVENSLHWSLDVSFNEDVSRIRNGYAAENFSRLRRIALNLLKRETTEKVGIKVKRLRAGWDEDYLLKVLTA